MATKTFTNAGDALSVQARDTALFAVTGTYAGGPVAFLGSVDGGVTFPLPVYGYPGGQTPGVTQTTLATNQSGQWLLDTRGLTHVMAKDLNGLGGAAVTLLPTAAPFFRLSGGSSAAGAAAGGLQVLSLPGGVEATHVNHGFFWPTVQGYDLGNGFLWEAWVQPAAMAGSGYLVSDGYGGAHSLLWGLNSVPGQPTGNLWNGTASINFGGGYVVAAGEWVHVALLWTKTAIYSFVNGVCDGQVAFTGPRVTPAPGGPGVLYVGGSDHLNLAMRIAALRGYDRGLPFSTNTTWGTAFRPERRFGIDAARSVGTGTRQPDFLADYTVPGVTIPDHSPAGCVSGVNYVPAPGTVTPTLASGGTLTTGQAYFYKVTCLNPGGESTPSAEATATPTGATLTVSLAWTAVAGADSYNVYRSTTTGAETFLANTSTASYSDTGAVATTPNVVPPVLNETGYPTRHPGYLENLTQTTGAATNQGAAEALGRWYDAKCSWVSDPTCPYSQAVDSTLPAEAIPSPAAVPTGALAFDSFGRRNQTYAFQSAPTLGSTEGGSLGPLAWQTSAAGAWGILGGAAVPLALTTQPCAIAWVPVGTADQDIRVTNRRGGFWNRGTGIAFRVQDALNFWWAFAYGDPTTSLIFYGSTSAGVVTAITSVNPGTAWDILRVTAVGTTITIYTDATQRVQLTAQTLLQTAQGAGIVGGHQGIYVHSLYRYRNWTVFQG